MAPSQGHTFIVCSLGELVQGVLMPTIVSAASACRPTPIHMFRMLVLLCSSSCFLMMAPMLELQWELLKELLMICFHSS